MQCSKSRKSTDKETPPTVDPFPNIVRQDPKSIHTTPIPHNPADEVVITSASPSPPPTPPQQPLQSQRPSQPSAAPASSCPTRPRRVSTESALATRTTATTPAGQTRRVCTACGWVSIHAFMVSFQYTKKKIKGLSEWGDVRQPGQASPSRTEPCASYTLRASSPGWWVPSRWR